MNDEEITGHAFCQASDAIDTLIEHADDGCDDSLHSLKQLQNRIQTALERLE